MWADRLNMIVLDAMIGALPAGVYVPLQVTFRLLALLRISLPLRVSLIVSLMRPLL